MVMDSFRVGPATALALVVAAASLAAAQTSSSTAFTTAPRTTQASAPPTTTARPSQSVAALSDCHMHGATQVCMAGTAEYEIVTSATRTEELPSRYTDCHSHGTELYCVDPAGEDVAVRPEGASSTESADRSGSGEESRQDHGGDAAAGIESEENNELSCHFHTGVEHCVGAGESEGSAPKRCNRVDRDYNVGLRVGTLFAILVSSAIGVFGPIFLASYARKPLLRTIFVVVKQFGVGVILSTAFVHLYTHAMLMFTNECLGDLDYESTTAAIVMTGLIISFVIDYLAHRLVMSRQRRSLTPSDGSPPGSVQEGTNKGHAITDAGQHGGAQTLQKSATLNVVVLEAGIIFHSLLLGLTSVVAGDSHYVTLFIVVLFHQFFEGVALGTRIGELPSKSPASSTYPETANSAPASVDRPLSLPMKLLIGLPYALVTPTGMAIGIGVLDRFDGNDPATIIAIGTLDALSAGILVWVGIVEMLAKDWFQDGELARASPEKVVLAAFGLLAGMILMSLLGKWI